MTPTIESSMEVERDEFAFSREDVETYELTEEERDGPSFATEAEAAEYYPPFIAHAYTHLQGIFPQLPPDLAVYPLLQSFQRQFSQDRGIAVSSIHGNPKNLGIVCVPDAQNQHYEKVMFGNKKESPAFAASKAILALASLGNPVMINGETANLYLFEILSYFIAQDVDRNYFMPLVSSIDQGNTHEARRNATLLMEQYSVEVLSLGEFEEAFRSLCIRVLKDPNMSFAIRDDGTSISTQDLLIGFLGDKDNIAYAYKYYVLRKKGRATRDRMTEIVQRNAALHASAAALAEAVQLHTTTRAAEVVHTPFSPITIEEGAEKLPTVQEVQQVFEDAFREAEALKGIHGTYSKPTIDRMLAIGKSHSTLLLAQHTDTIALADLEAMCAEVLFVMATEYYLCLPDTKGDLVNTIYRSDCSRSVAVMRRSLDALCQLHGSQYISPPNNVGITQSDLVKKYGANTLKAWEKIDDVVKETMKSSYLFFRDTTLDITRLFFIIALSQCSVNHMIDLATGCTDDLKTSLRQLNAALVPPTLGRYFSLPRSSYALSDIQARATALFQEAVQRHQAENVDGGDADDAVPIPYGLAMQQLDEAKLEDVTRAMILDVMKEHAKEVGITFTEAGKFFGAQEGITAIPERMCSRERDLFSLCLHVYIEQYISHLATQKMREKDDSVDFCTISTCLIVSAIAKKFDINTETEGVHWYEMLASIASIKTLCGVSEPPTQNNEATLISHKRIHQLAQESATKTFFQTKPYVIAKELSEEILQRINAMIDFGLQTLREIHKGDHYSFLDVFEILNHIFYSSVLYISGDAELLMKNPVTFQSWNNVYKRFVVTFLEKIRDYFEQLKQDIIKQETLAIDASFLALPSDITDRLQHSPLADKKILRTVTDPLRSHKNNGLADNAPERTVHNEAFRQFRDGASAWNAMSNPPRFCFPVCTPDTFQLFLKAVAYGISMVKNTEIQEELRALWIEWVRHYGTPTANDDTQDSSTSTSNDHSQEQEVSTDDNNASSSNTQAETTPKDPLLECLEALGVDESRVQERVLQYCTDRLDQGAANLLALSLSTTNQGDIEAMTLELQSFLQHATELLQEAIATCVQTSGTMTHAVMQNVVANVSTSIASSAPTGGTHFSSSSLASLVLSVIEELMLCERAKDYLELFDAQQSSTPPLSSSADDVSVTYPRLEAVKRTAQRRKQEAAERAVAVQRQRRMKEEVPQRLQEARNRLESLLALLTDVGERASAGDESAEYDAIHIPAGIDTIYHLITATRGRPQ